MLFLHRATPSTSSSRDRRIRSSKDIAAGGTARGNHHPGRSQPSRKSRLRSRPGLEFMEERAMMSNIPVFESLNVINGTNPIVQVAPMVQTILHGNFQNGATSDTVRVQLQSGELFTAGLNVVYPIYNSDLGSGLKVTDPRGVQVATESTYVFGGQISTDPISGAATTDTQVAFRAATSGTYTIEVDDIPWLGAYLGSPSYNLSLRPVELDKGSLMPNANAQDAAKLQFSGGGLYSWLDSTHSVLTFSGPTGRGFQIDGQFSETTSPVSGSSFTTSTIVGTGKLVLQSGYGSVALPLPAGLELVVTTQANGYNGLFGEVASAGLQFPYSQTGGELADPVAAYSGNNLVGTINSGLSRLGGSDQRAECQLRHWFGRPGQPDHLRRPRRSGHSVPLSQRERGRVRVFRPGAGECWGVRRFHRH